jgi:hypothetical protein
VTTNHTPAPPLIPDPKPIAFAFAGILSLCQAYVHLTPRGGITLRVQHVMFISLSPHIVKGGRSKGHHQTGIMKQIRPFTTLCTPNPLSSIWNAFQRHNDKQCVSDHYSTCVCVRACVRANECCTVAIGGEVQIRFAPTLITCNCGR